MVALGDSVLGLNAQSRTVSRMIELFEARRASCVVAVQEVPPETTGRYGIVQVAESHGDVFRVRGVVEKPDPDKAPSNLAFVGRYVFSPLVFDLVRRVEPDRRGNLQLTDAIGLMCEEGKRVLALQLAPGERRYEIGDFPSYFETFAEFALADPLYGVRFRSKLERLLDSQPNG